MVIERKHIPEDIYQKYKFIFDRYDDERETCKSCTGIEHCLLHTNGWITIVRIDGSDVPIEDRAPCAYKVKAQKYQTQNRILYSTIPESLQKLSMKNIGGNLNIESEEYQDAVNRCIASVQNKRGVFLSGKPGVGKTYLLTAIWNDLVAKSSSKPKFAFANVSRFLDDLKKRFGKGDQVNQLLEKIKNADILVLDDLGCEQVTNWSRDQILFSILDYRMNNNLFTCFTSNYPVKKLEEKYNFENTDIGKIAAIRLVERIKTLSDEIYIPGDSRRHD